MILDALIGHCKYTVFRLIPLYFGASLVAPMVKNMLAMQETRVQSLGQKDPLEKKMATHSSILAWKIPQTEKPDGLQSMWSQKGGIQLSNSTTTNLSLLVKYNFLFLSKTLFKTNFLQVELCDLFASKWPRG